MQAAIVIGMVSAGAARAAPGSPPAVERTVLKNGMRLLVVPQPHLPMVVVNALVDAGSRFDALGKEGLASLCSTLLLEGTEKRSAAEIHDQIDFLGVRLGSSAGDDYASVGLTTLKKDLGKGMDLLADVVLHPKFAAREFERKRAEALAELEAEEQSPGALADRAFRKALYGSGPYRSGPGGWKDSVAKLTAANLKSFYEAAYRPDRTVLVAAGDVTLEEMTGIVEKLFGGWSGKGPSATLPPSPGKPKPEVIRIDRDLTQANLIYGHGGTTRDDPDWYAIQVMNYILGGGGFSSRMMASIRIEAGLAYSVHSYFIPGKLPGSFQVGLQTKSATTAEALRRLEKEIERIRTDPVGEDELDAAKKYLTGSFPLRFDSNAELVGFYSQVEYYTIGLDYPARYDGLINSVTKEDVLRVAKKYLHPEEAILVVVGKQKEISLPEKPKS